VTLSHGCDGLSVRWMAVVWTCREPSLCRHVHRELLRSAWLDLTPIRPATACHQRNDVERYSRYKFTIFITLPKVFRALALKALAVDAIPPPWLPQATTTIALSGADADEPKISRAPQPAYGHSKEGRDDLQQVLLRLGVSGEGGLPRRVGGRDGNRRESVETPGASAACLALGLEGVRGIVADSQA
jgi:transposase